MPFPDTPRASRLVARRAVQHGSLQPAVPAARRDLRDVLPDPERRARWLHGGPTPSVCRAATGKNVGEEVGAEFVYASARVAAGRFIRGFNQVRRQQRKMEGVGETGGDVDRLSVSTGVDATQDRWGVRSADPKPPLLGGTTTTGQTAVWMVASATLPTCAARAAPSPRVPSTMYSTASSSASLRRPSAGSPLFTRPTASVRPEVSTNCSTSPDPQSMARRRVSPVSSGAWCGQTGASGGTRAGTSSTNTSRYPSRSARTMAVSATTPA